MELFLNSAWALMAIVIALLWARLGMQEKGEKRLSFVALAMLVLILFPVISVSDDLWSLQNPAETDTCQRHDHFASIQHALFPVASAFPEPALAEMAFGFEWLPGSLGRTPLFIEKPALTSIQNRPPPSA